MFAERITGFLKYAVAAIVLLSLVLPAVPAGAGERLSISVNVANIRSGPGTDHPVIWRMERNAPVTVVARQGDWIFFEDFEKTRGWIHADLLDNTPTVITRGDGRSNIRSSSGTEHEVRFQAEAGVPFKVLGRQGPWINIEHADGDVGWIHETRVW